MRAGGSTARLIEDAANALTSPRHTLRAAPAVLPNCAGLYASYGSRVSWRLLGLDGPPDARPLYVGKAERSLVTRDLQTHFKSGRTGQSTVRRTFAAMLRTDLGFRGVPRNLSKPSRFANYALSPDYPYSSGNFTLYLGVRGLDLRDHGFGSWNVWHYPHDDLNAIYRRQLVDQDYRDPWLFMSTPTLHTDEPGLCPPGHQILELATSAPYAPWRALRDTDRRRYNVEKKRVRDRLVEIVEQHYVPNLSKHLAIRVMGTPATNERYCGAPAGNAYGIALTPRHIGRGRIPNETPLANLWLVNATTGYPSVAGTVRAGLDLHARLA